MGVVEVIREGEENTVNLGTSVIGESLQLFFFIIPEDRACLQVDRSIL